jgi:hypothetical protein
MRCTTGQVLVVSGRYMICGNETRYGICAFMHNEGIIKSMMVCTNRGL